MKKSNKIIIAILVAIHFVVLSALVAIPIFASPWNAVTSSDMTNWADSGPTNDSPSGFVRVRVDGQIKSNATSGFTTIISNAATLIMSNGILAIDAGTPSTNMWNALNALPPTNAIDIIVHHP